jgi:hypothetical protein
MPWSLLGHMCLRVGFPLKHANFEQRDSCEMEASPVENSYAFPISIPVIKTNAPPNATCIAAESGGVSMKR